MNTFVNIKTGERFPEHGCGHWFWIKEKTKWKDGAQIVTKKFTIFEQGKGWRNGKLSEWRQETIPDFAGAEPNPNDPIPNDTEWKAYAEKYGIVCAREFLSCCDMMKPTWAFQIVNPPTGKPSATAQAWFENLFGINPLCMAIPILMIMGNRYSFDVLRFERLLKNQFGYDPESDTQSMRGFMEDKWGAEVASYFAKEFLAA